MADEQQAPATEKKGSPVKMIAIIAGIMLVEAVAVAGFMMMVGGKPEAAEASVDGLDEADLDRHVEILLAEDRFQNLQSGRVWLWETSVHMKVKARHEEWVQAELERRSAEITAGVAQIIRKASASQLKEPGLETLTRQFTAYAHTIFGTDADGENRIDQILIPKCRGFPADF